MVGGSPLMKIREEAIVSVGYSFQLSRHDVLRLILRKLSRWRKDGPAVRNFEIDLFEIAAVVTAFSHTSLR